MNDTDSAKALNNMIVIFFLFFLSVSFSGFFIDRTDEITLIVSPDYDEINRTKGKYRTIDEVDAHRKSKNRSATVVFNGSGEEYSREKKKNETDIIVMCMTFFKSSFSRLSLTCSHSSSIHFARIPLSLYHYHYHLTANK